MPVVASTTKSEPLDKVKINAAPAAISSDDLMNSSPTSDHLAGETPVTQELETVIADAPTPDFDTETRKATKFHHHT